MYDQRLMSDERAAFSNKELQSMLLRWHENRNMDAAAKIFGDSRATTSPLWMGVSCPSITSIIIGCPEQMQSLPDLIREHRGAGRQVRLYISEGFDPGHARVIAVDEELIPVTIMRPHENGRPGSKRPEMTPLPNRGAQKFMAQGLGWTAEQIAQACSAIAWAQSIERPPYVQQMSDPQDGSSFEYRRFTCHEGNDFISAIVRWPHSCRIFFLARAQD